MKILFINPPTLIGDISFLGKQYPLSIMILAAYLRQFGIEVGIWDANAETFSEERLVRELEEYSPDMVGLTAFTSTVNNAAHIAGLIKGHNPEIVTIVGGTHPSALPERTMREFPEFDLLVFGEGEKTLLETVEAVGNPRLLSEVKGLCYRKDGNVVMNEPRELIRNIDEIPFPARDLIPRHLYKSSSHRNVLSQPAQVDALITARGCMGKCTFCASKTVFHGRVRYRGIENVLKEINECKERWGTEHIWIMDETFTTSMKRLSPICNELKRLEIPWNCSGRVDLVNEEKIKLMAESGCRLIQFGVESGSQRILDLMKKEITVDQIKAAFKWSDKYGITADAPVILGADPSETMADIKLTEKLIREIKPLTFAVSILMPFPGTEIRKKMLEKGYIRDEKWEDYLFFGQTPPNFRTDNFTYQELKKIQRRMLMKFYFWPGYLWNKLRSIKNPREFRYWFKVGIDFIKSVVFSSSGKKYMGLTAGTANRKDTNRAQQN